MFKIKICGLSRPDDIEMVNIAKPDYIGFVFAKSKRQINADTAKQLKMLLDPSIRAVGVFVNEAIDVITRLCRECVIDIIQLHGDETQGYINELRSIVSNPIIKAVRINDCFNAAQANGISCDYLLLDTYNKNQYGGSGETFDWSVITKTDKPIFLAGGINGDNVKQAIKQAAPYCIDVSSGVETNGFKDFDKILNIINTVRSVQ